jgi:hypothetical protein
MRLGVAAVVVLACCFGSVGAQQADEPESRGQMAFTYQYNRARGFNTSYGEVVPEDLTTHVIDFAASYRVKDRWTVSLGLPLTSREWKGPPLHDPLAIIPPQPDSRFIDDNHFHTYLQDLRFGASYLVTGEPIAFEPYLEYSVPASDYPFFGSSTPGRHLQTIEVGSTLAYRPPFLRWYFALKAGYAMSDKVLGYETDAVRVTLESAYFVTPRLTVNAFLHSKNGKGWHINPNAIDFTSETWYRHDQFTRHNFMTLGAGVDWALDDRNVLNVTTMNMVHAEDIYKLRKALSVTFSRSF